MKENSIHDSSSEDSLKQEYDPIPPDTKEFDNMTKSTPEMGPKSKITSYFKIPEKYIITPGKKPSETQNKNPWEIYQEKAQAGLQNENPVREEKTPPADQNKSNKKPIQLKITKVELMRNDERTQNDNQKIQSNSSKRLLKESLSVKEFKKYAEDLQSLDFSNIRTRPQAMNDAAEINFLPNHAALFFVGESEKSTLKNGNVESIEEENKEVEKRRPWDKSNTKIQQDLPSTRNNSCITSNSAQIKEDSNNQEKISGAKSKDRDINQNFSNIQRHLGFHKYK